MFIKIKNDTQRLNELIDLGAIDCVKFMNKLQYDNEGVDDWQKYEITLKRWPKIFLELNDIFLIERYLENRHRRNKRLRNHIEKLLKSDKPIFGTLTFTNDTLENTTPEKRRDLVARFLKASGCNYVANIDYGKKKQREHYHFISDIRISPKEWQKYGAIKLLQIKSNSSALRLARYLNKLYNHAIKDTTKNSKIIYSRVRSC